MYIAKPTIIAAVAYFVLSLILLLPFHVGQYDPKYDETRKFDFKYRLLLVLFMLIPIGISLYSINCMFVGKCYIWSYLHSLIICVWVMLFFLASLIASERI